MISPELLVVLMFGGILLGGLAGYPLALVLGATGLIGGLLVLGEATFDLYYMRVFGSLTSYPLIAIPLFVFMGVMLEKSGISERMFEALYVWLGGLKGGLCLTTILMGTIMAAAVGIIGASVTMLSVIALPFMIKHGYDKRLASGAVCAGGSLGILIPPSIMIVIYGPTAGLSVGRLFFAAMLPGLLLSGLYIVYVTVLCSLKPEMGPPIPSEEREISLAKKTTMLLTSMLPMVVLIFAVLGAIFFGVAPPTEAAAVGAFASLVLAIAYHKLTWSVLKETTFLTMKLSGMILFIAAMSATFTGVFIAGGGGAVVADLVLATPGGKWGVFAVIMFIVFLLGMFIDWIGIVLVLVPIITPIGAVLGFDPLWFAIMIMFNLQMSFLTPPFAYAIFYVRGAAPPELELDIMDIIRGVIPFTILVMVGLGLLIAFPDIILWLPARMIK